MIAKLWKSEEKSLEALFFRLQRHSISTEAALFHSQLGSDLFFADLCKMPAAAAK